MTHKAIAVITAIIMLATMLPSGANAASETDEQRQAFEDISVFFGPAEIPSFPYCEPLEPTIVVEAWNCYMVALTTGIGITEAAAAYARLGWQPGR